ncbi:MAG: hypothetical protein IIA44_11340 [Acidobacteria bacterium]|nr:hypothetical protein [Acidobacteriota bacterium]
MIKRTAFACGLMVATAWPVAVHGQFGGLTARLKDPKVQIVQTVGCVEQRGDDAGGWWLTRAAEPTVVKPGVFDETQIEEAQNTATGSREFQLIGAAEFLDAKSQLEWGDRAQFTTAEQVNATNELRKGRTVLVKGLLIDPDGDARINLLSVVGLADTCQ